MWGKGCWMSGAAARTGKVNMKNIKKSVYKRNLEVYIKNKPKAEYKKQWE